MERPHRKPNRIENYDYSLKGAYFVTICTRDRKPLLSKIVGDGALNCPKAELLMHGTIADKYIRQMDTFYNHLSVDKYVIMPDHIHLLITISGRNPVGTGVPDGPYGDMGLLRTVRRPVPTRQNAQIPKFVSTFKRFCNKEYGENIWQSRYYDHVVRNQQDYNEIWEYIDNNPLKWVMTKQGRD